MSVDFLGLFRRYIVVGISVLLFFTVMYVHRDKFAWAYSKNQHDLRAYVACAHNILAGRHIYKFHHKTVPEDPSMPKRGAPAYLYPPLLGIMMIPTTVVTFVEFRPFWFFLNIIFLLHSVFLLVTFLPFDRLKWLAFSIIASIAMISTPFRWLLKSGQVDMLVIYLSVASLYHFGKEQFARSAILICIATWIKVTPGIFLVYFLLRGNRRFFYYSLGAGVLLGLVQLAVVQGQMFYFFEHLISKISNRFGPPYAQSLWALSKLLVIPGKRSMIFDAPDAFDSLLLGLKILTSTLTLAVLVRQKPGRVGLYLGFAVCNGFSMLITDLSWIMRFAGNLVSVAAILLLMTQIKNKFGSAVWMVLGFGILLLNSEVFWKDVLGPLRGWKSIFIAGPSVHAVVMVVILSGFYLSKSEFAPAFRQAAGLLRFSLRKSPAQ